MTGYGGMVGHCGFRLVPRLAWAGRLRFARSKIISAEGRGATQVPPLRFAPVGMTILKAVACMNSSVPYSSAELPDFHHLGWAE
jgi:hypothetical protein